MSEHDPSQETVILIHGLGRTRASLGVMQICLKWAGYKVCNFPYSARKNSFQEIVDSLLAYIETEVESQVYHFVAHSLGNIIIRQGFHKGYPPELKRIVMLAPPNHPVKLAAKLKNNLLFQYWSGDSGKKLASPEFYAQLPVPSVEFGVIAGTKGQKWTFQEPNDGIVELQATKLEGMKDFLTVHHTHTFLMNGSQTIQETIHFLKKGCFANSSLNREKGSKVL
ncbi:MAG: hypothetical protein D6785_09765 [Planctomycetota bacterium]|nr:MAG: hypothetical protein D6785_09765 [Planctomycetota bacterium]